MKSKLKTKWKTKFFGDCAELIKDTCKPNKDESTSYIGLEHIEQNTLQLNGIGNSSEIISNKFKFCKGDILFGKLRPYFRKVVCPDFNGICSTDIFVVRSKPGIAQKFLYFWMASQEFVNQATQSSTGTKMPRADWNFLCEIEKELPDIEEQEKISNILWDFQQLIINLNEQNKILEKIIQTLFKSWFIDFDGQTEFVDSELGKIPKGWTVKSVYDCANYVNGDAFRKSDFSSDNSGLPIIKIAELKSGVSSITNFTNQIVDPKYLLHNGDVLFSWSGSPDTSIDIFIWTGGKAILNQHIFKINPLTPDNKPFIFSLLTYLKKTFIEIARNKQTTGLGHVTKTDLEKLMIALPDDNLIKQFQLLVNPLFHLLCSNGLNSQILIKSQNTLSLKLLSGEIRV